MRKQADRLIIESAPPKSLLAVLETLAPIQEDFPPISDLRVALSPTITKFFP